MISVVLVIAPDSKNSNQLAFDRMKANILGSSIGLICIGVILNIIIGTFLKLHTAMRSSLAALVIVMIHEAQQNSTWHIALDEWDV